MFKNKKVYVTIVFPDIAGIFDYPKHLPLPSKDDEIHLDGRIGKVEYIKHMTNGNTTDIRIKCVRILN